MTTAAVDVSGLIDFSTISGWTLVALAGVVLGTWLAARYARRGVLGWLGHIDGISTELASTTARIVAYFLILIGVGLGMAVLGAEIQPFLAAAILVAIVVVLALRGVADNFGASVILQTRKPVRHGDWIEVDGHTGVVSEMNARSVVLRTADGRQIHVPNAYLLAEPIVNLSTTDGVRSEIEIRTSDPSVADALVRSALDAARQTPGVMDDQPVDVVWRASGPASLTGRLRFWHASAVGVTVSSAVLRAVSERLAQDGLVAHLSWPPPPPPQPIISMP